MASLHVVDTTPIDLDGSLVAGAVKVAYGASELDDEMFAEHSDEEIAVIRIKLIDFTDSGDTWEMSATHGSHTWARGSGYAYFDWGYEPDFVQVAVVATNSTNQDEEEKILQIKTQPEGAF